MITVPIGLVIAGFNLEALAHQLGNLLPAKWDSAVGTPLNHLLEAMGTTPTTNPQVPMDREMETMASQTRPISVSPPHKVTKMREKPEESTKQAKLSPRNY
ncbi:hypothetical protein DSO57_1007956 [Entomophthora muscae]|uniref:Uncharacterized protein n=1 Tax=Entomophthora muscae TaxID=34485 RepID=A0ACC2SWF3_9FUNG|nr:hypothetical protein DSO57_1007956 [Entomophthora muscae]